MHVGVTGSREGINSHQSTNLSRFINNNLISNFHHGDCVGADVEVAAAVKSAFPKCSIVCHPPTNPSLRGYFPSDMTMPEDSYFARNRDIVDYSSVLIGFPCHRNRGQGGTWYTINYAIKADIPVFIFHANGEVERHN